MTLKRHCISVFMIFLIPFITWGFTHAGLDADMDTYGMSEDLLKRKVVVFRASTDYSNKVPVNMTVDKQRISHYPHPQELRTNRPPLNIGKGYFMDFDGMSPSSMYINMTRKEYSQLKEKPKKGEINRKIIVNSYIETFIVMPFTYGQYFENPSIIDEFIDNGFTKCRVIKGTSIQYGNPDNVIGTIY